MSVAHRWVSYWSGGRPSDAVKQATDRASGAYAIRRKDSKGVVYVGESDLGHMWRTLARHFQAPVTFTAKKKPGGGNAFATDKPSDYEVTWQITSRGKRQKKHGDQRAKNLQARWIKKFRKAGHRLHNIDDGLANAQVTREYHAAKARHVAEQEADAWGGLLNPGKKRRKANPEPVTQAPAPGAALTSLGRLTRVSYFSGKVHVRDLLWPLSRAPMLAYDGMGRLHVVYMGKVQRASSAAEMAEYRRTHWGAEPFGRVSGGGVGVGPWVLLGEGFSITYTTKKGSDAASTDYVHLWGEGGPRTFTRPKIVEHACKGGCRTSCGASGAIAIAGGSYAVSSRGIVG